MAIWDNIRKRLSLTTYNSSQKAKRFSVFTFRNTPAYNNHTTWLEIYAKEPFIRGAIDSKVNAIVGEWTVETVNTKPSEAELKLVERVKNELSDPSLYLSTKLRTIAYRLIIDTIAYVEVARGDMNFYILNPEECQLNWADGDKYVNGIRWSRAKQFEKEEDYNLLMGKDYAFGSMFDPDTNLYKKSPMETIIGIANLLKYARDYNLDIFERGGVPAMLFSLPKDTGDEEFLRFDNMIKRAKSGSNIIALGDVKTQPLAGFTKDMEYDKLVNHGVQSIMSLLQVSPQMMSMGGTNSPSGGESARQEMNSFATGVHNIQNIINELMTQIVINLYSKDDEDVSALLPRRGRPVSDHAKNLRFKLKKWTDKRQQSAIHKIYLDTSVLTPNEVRADLGKEAVEWGDEPLKGGAGSMGNTGAENPMGQPEREPEMDESDEAEQDTAQRESDSQEAEKR